MKEDYTLQMSEKRAKIYGEMSLSHLFELLNFLDLQGFDEVQIDEYDGKMILDKAQEADLTHEQKEFLEQQKIYNSQKEDIMKKLLENQEAQKIMNTINKITGSYD